MMNFRWSFVPALVFAATASAAIAAQNWSGALVMPKSEQVEIRDDNGAAVRMDQIAWPAQVQRTKERFLWVQDEGGYSRRQAGGWIYADDVVKLDDAHDYYAGELRSRETPWLNWMCGVSWENSEPGVAALYYQKVLALDPNTQLDDVHIRLGRLLAQQQLQSGHGTYKRELRDAWERQFQNAQSINPNRPQLYYEWGLALSQACACTQAKALAAQLALAQSPAAPAKGPTSAQDQAATRSLAPSETIAPGIASTSTSSGEEAAVQSLSHYERAEQLSPRWWRIPLARAELMLNQCDQESADYPGERALIASAKPEFYTQLVTHCHRKSAPANNAVETTPAEANSANAAAIGQAAVPPYMQGVLTIAMDDFNRSISLNANALDAYRDRAEVLRLMHRLGEAQQSATTACKLCYYRQAGSLRTLAQINNDLQLYQPAADYALRAAELAGGDDQQRYLKLWYKCSKQCTDDTAKIAVASAQAGYVASRGDDDNAENAALAKPPAHVEPPPGFLSRAAGATPD